ncbi:MAG: hypothetical protein JJE09_03215 [Bacteroidia bacterium]|nr:hypothetical protein [Bacteroidia bacterium]
MAGAKNLVFTVLALLTPTLIFSQQHQPDTLFITAAIENAKKVYYQSVMDHSNLYNGKEYIAFKKNMPQVGTPFFQSEDWTEGKVFYDGELYENVSIRFDLLQEKLMVEHKGIGEIELISEKIKYFEIAGHTFVKFQNNGIAKSLSAGFYDLIYNGTSKVLVRRLKVGEEKIETQVSIILTFKEKNTIGILKNGVYHVVNNKSSVLKIFEDQKSDLKKFISKNKIRYRSNREEAIVKIAEQYDQLTH